RSPANLRLSGRPGMLPVRGLGLLDAGPAAQSVPGPAMDTVRIAVTHGCVRELRQDPLHGARLGGIESLGLDHVAVELFAAERVGCVDADGIDAERDARQRRDAVSGALPEFWGDVRFLRAALLARGDQ